MSLFSHEADFIKLIFRGKKLSSTAILSETGMKDKSKLMIVASTRDSVQQVQSSKSDSTIRGLDAEIAIEQKRQRVADNRSKVASEWATEQHGQYKFCRFVPIDAHFEGDQPHAYEASALLKKLAHDPGIVDIMVRYEWTVGSLKEMDADDDRLAKQIEQEGKCLLGYNTNAGTSIDIRLRTDDRRGFRPYNNLLNTLLHELAHNVFGPHDSHFWALFAQLKAEYLVFHKRQTEQGVLYHGHSSAAVADLGDQLADIRQAVQQEVAQDRRSPMDPAAAMRLEAALADAVQVGGWRAGGWRGGCESRESDSLTPAPAE